MTTPLLFSGPRLRPVWDRLSSESDAPGADAVEPTEVILWVLADTRTRGVGLRRLLPENATVYARMKSFEMSLDPMDPNEAYGPLDQAVTELRMDPTRETDEDDGFCLFPIRYPKLWEMYQRSKAAFWVPEEIDFVQDLKDFETLSDPERRYIELILAFFASADNLVMKNLGDNFLQEVKIPEVRQFYAFQEGMEAIHAETYNLSIDVLVRDQGRKRELFRAIQSVSSIRAKAAWVKHWIGNAQLPFALRVLAFACVEGIFFSSSFCALFWLKKRGLMPGLTLSNEFISRDEGLHTLFACELYREMGAPVAASVIRGLVAEAVYLEDRFVEEALPGALLGMNASSMKAYVRFVADWLLTELGQEKLYHEENPFPFMSMISLEGKTNFFERKVSNYSKISCLNGSTERTLEFTDDF